MLDSTLQNMLSEFGCTVIDYTNNKIMVDFFYSEKMYEKYLSGFDCKQGIGMYETDQVLVFNSIPDEKMVVVKKDHAVAKYKYSTISKSTIVYKGKNVHSKIVNKSLTFRIRTNKFDELFNFIDTEGNAFDFFSINEIKDYLNNKYGAYKYVEGSDKLE